MDEMKEAEDEDPTTVHSPPVRDQTITGDHSSVSGRSAAAAAKRDSEQALAMLAARRQRLEVQPGPKLTPAPAIASGGRGNRQHALCLLTTRLAPSHQAAGIRKALYLCYQLFLLYTKTLTPHHLPHKPVRRLIHVEFRRSKMTSR
jgi:hypothetical protein